MQPPTALPADEAEPTAPLGDEEEPSWLTDAATALQKRAEAEAEAEEEQPSWLLDAEAALQTIDAVAASRAQADAQAETQRIQEAVATAEAAAALRVQEATTAAAVAVAAQAAAARQAEETMAAAKAEATRHVQAAVAAAEAEAERRVQVAVREAARQGAAATAAATVSLEERLQAAEARAAALQEEPRLVVQLQPTMPSERKIAEMKNWELKAALSAQGIEPRGRSNGQLREQLASLATMRATPHYRLDAEAAHVTADGQLDQGEVLAAVDPLRPRTASSANLAATDARSDAPARPTAGGSGVRRGGGRKLGGARAWAAAAVGELHVVPDASPIRSVRSSRRTT